MQALGFLHKHNILYNDLKLENVLVQMDGYCKLIDLGKHATRHHTSTSTPRLTPSPHRATTTCCQPLVTHITPGCAGLSYRIESKDDLLPLCGTPANMAPEVCTAGDSLHMFTSPLLKPHLFTSLLVDPHLFTSPLLDPHLFTSLLVDPHLFTSCRWCALALRPARE